MESDDLPFHELSNLFPLLTGQEFDDLKVDIEKHGQHEPILTYQGQIIDGRNRYRACRELGIEPRLQEWDGNGSLVAFVLSLNLHRRHLTSSQRAAIAAELLPILEAEAKERQRAAGGNRKKAREAKDRANGALPVKVPEPLREDGEARQQAAQMTGTNARYVTLAKQIKEADAQLFEQVKAGEVHVMEARSKVKRQERRAEEERRAAETRQQREADILDRRPLKIVPNRVAGDFDRLKAETATRPEFDRRQEEIDQQQRQVDEIDQEIERIEQLYAERQRLHNAAYMAQQRLHEDIGRQVEAEHGRRVTAWEGHVSVRDEAVQAKLEEALNADDDQEVHELLLREIGRCIECAAKLDERDDVPDEPGMRYVMCSWCRNLPDRGDSDDEPEALDLDAVLSSVGSRQEKEQELKAVLPAAIQDRCRIEVADCLEFIH
jgi:hypothetical protein